MVDLDALPRIDSAANDRLKAVRRLVKARDRRREGLFVIEGFRELRRAVDGGLVIRDVFVATSDWTGRQEAGLVDEIVGGGARISVLSSKAFASIATQDAPDGLLGVADIPAARPVRSAECSSGQSVRRRRGHRAARQSGHDRTHRGGRRCQWADSVQTRR